MPAEHHRPGLNQRAECGSTAHSAIISTFQLSPILPKPALAKPAPTLNPHSRPAPRRSPAGSFFGGFRTPAPFTGSIARAGPASETLLDTRPSRPRSGTGGSNHSGHHRHIAARGGRARRYVEAARRALAELAVERRSATPTTPRQRIGIRLIFAHVGAQFEITSYCLV